MKKENIKFALCHQIPQRSFHFRGKQFPVCSRCTGVLLGYLTFPLFYLELISPNLTFVLLFSAPMIIDSIIQARGMRESNNTLRLITGFLFGMGQVALIIFVGNLVVSLIIR